MKDLKDYDITKMVTIKRSERDCWYDQRKVRCEIFVSRNFKGEPHPYGCVSIMLFSIDDFCMRYEKEIYDECEVDDVYNHVKKYIFDRFPRRVSFDWLNEHSFFAD